MKTIISLIFIALLAGCTSSTTYGECVGLGEDKNPNLHYKVSVLNVVMAIVFSQTIVVPVVVAVDEFYCPVGYK